MLSTRPYTIARLGLLAALSLVLLSKAAAAAPPEDRIAARTPEPFQSYIKECGYPIVFKNTFRISIARIDRRFGAVIILDPRLDSPLEGPHRRFLIAHECAHHRLGHTSPKGLRFRRQGKGVEDQELSADCWAAETLVRAGLANDARLMVDRFYRAGLHSPGSKYPSGVQRSSMIYHCMRKAARKLLAERDPDQP